SGRIFEKAHSPGREIVVTDHAVAVCQETVCQVAPNEAGGSRDEKGHYDTRRSLWPPAGDGAACQSPIRNTPFTTAVVIRTTPHAIDIASVSFNVSPPVAPSVLAMAISRPPHPM